MDDMYNEGQNHYGSQGKLVLSSRTDSSSPSHPLNGETSFMPAGDGQTSFMPAGAPPFAPGGSGYYPQGQPKKGLFQKLRTDPAYQVLAVAIVVVLIASGSLVAFAATGMMNTGSNHGSPNQQQAKVQSSPVTHATPAPTQAPTPTMMPTQQVPTQAPAPVTQPTQAPTNPMGNLTVAFVGAPGQVNNGQTTTITVQTNQAGVAVQLAVTYTGAIGNSIVQPPIATTNNAGIANFQWTANATPFNVNNPNVTAHLTVTAMNNNGQPVTQTADVTVVFNANGGK